MPGENGLRQQAKLLDIRENGDESNSEKIEKPRWGGIEDIMIAYSEYSKGKQSPILDKTIYCTRCVKRFACVQPHFLTL